MCVHLRGTREAPIFGIVCDLCGLARLGWVVGMMVRILELRGLGGRGDGDL